MRINLKGTMLGLAASALMTMAATPAKSADTLVTCKTPFADVNTGQDGSKTSDLPYTVSVARRRRASPLAYEISVNGTIAQLLSHAFETFEIQSRGAAVPISSDLSDTSGAAWGCGASNCRIIDYLPAK